MPLFDKVAFRVNDYVDIEKMKEACKYFIGEHDFESFVSQKSGKTNFVRIVYDAKIIEIDDGLYAFEITGNGFLYNMVRIMVGTLIKVGSNRLAKSDVQKMLETGKRSLGGKTLSAKGLSLVSVEY